MRASLPVSNFVFRHGERISDPAEAALALEDPAVTGQFASHRITPSGQHRLIRDALGVNKLFYAIDAAGEVHSANYWIDLLRAGHAPEKIWSVPAGYALSIDPAQRGLTLEKFRTLEFGRDEPVQNASSADFIPAIRASLHKTFAMLGRALRGREVYISLSGGLDSSAIAVLAREYIGEFTAVTFSLGRAGQQVSEDIQTASRIAQDLGVAFETIELPPDAVLAALDEVLIYGQDFRDFNVHCGLVNAAVAKAVAALHQQRGKPGRPLLLSGDTMNELMADYHEESYNGQTYYRLPRVPLAKLRELLVSGLDAGDREVGIFHHFGIDTIQPYAIAAPAYAALPPALLAGEDAKQQLVRQVLGEQIPHYVYHRPKTRAQSGSADNAGGTLAACVDHGFDSGYLAARFAELYGLETKSLHRYIRGGRYRFTSIYQD